MCDRKTIISTLEEIARLLELSGANPFKVRAYQNGARVLSAYEGDLAEGLASGELARLKGVGKGLLSEIDRGEGRTGPWRRGPGLAPHAPIDPPVESGSGRSTVGAHGIAPQGVDGEQEEIGRVRGRKTL